MILAVGIVKVVVLKRPPQSLYENIVLTPSSSIHVHGDAVALKQICKGLAGKLSALVGIENLWSAVAPDSLGDVPPKGFKCIQCGNCCMNLYDAFSTCATQDDIAMWQNEGRDDVLDWVSPIQFGTHFVYDIWINPVNRGVVRTLKTLS